MTNTELMKVVADALTPCLEGLGFKCISSAAERHGAWEVRFRTQESLVLRVAMELFHSVDPVHFEPEDGQWYFWDETWANRCGPYPTEEVAQQRATDYGVFLHTGVDPAGVGEPALDRGPGGVVGLG